MKDKIEQLKLIANDPTLSTELREAARRQLDKLQPPQPQVVEQTPTPEVVSPEEEMRRAYASIFKEDDRPRRRRRFV
jgi:hypothetical protein